MDKWRVNPIGKVEATAISQEVDTNDSVEQSQVLEMRWESQLVDSGSSDTSKTRDQNSTNFHTDPTNRFKNPFHNKELFQP